jgi:hypothetical protein
MTGLAERSSLRTRNVPVASGFAGNTRHNKPFVIGAAASWP